VGAEVEVAAAGEARPSGAGVAALAAAARPRDQVLATQPALQEAGEQVAAGAAVGAPLRIGQLGPDPGAIGRADDPRPLRFRDDLPLVIALARDPSRCEDAAQA